MLVGALRRIRFWGAWAAREGGSMVRPLPLELVVEFELKRDRLEVEAMPEGLEGCLAA
jgi:hypothetical protein